MKKIKLSVFLTSILLLLAVSVNLVGCTAIQAADLMAGITPNQVTPIEDMSSGNGVITDFAIRLFKETTEQGKNTLISPLSVISALAMTANGASARTLEQMESALGMSVEELNSYLYTYVNALPQGDKYKLSIANSIWFTEDDRFSVNQSFLQKNADYYGAELYKAPFDRQTLYDINNWVKKETDGMIPKVVDDIPSDAVMYLVNALAFDAEWMSVYEKDQVRDGEFTKEDETKQRVEMMYSTEYNYLEDESATGFIKYYKGGKYAFAALLPNEGISLSEYISSLDGAALSAMLSNAESTRVNTAIPKFEVDYDTELSTVLARMGMLDAFDVKQADFSNLGVYEGGNLYIYSVIHKTYIEVGEKGTRAGAVTAVGMNGGAMPNPEKPKEVYLDRPFVYMLIDTENNIPFFIGSMTEIE